MAALHPLCATRRARRGGRMANKRGPYGDAELDDVEQEFMDGIDGYDFVNVFGEWILPVDVLGGYRSRRKRGKMTHGQTAEFREHLATVMAAVRNEICSWLECEPRVEETADECDPSAPAYTPTQERVASKKPRRKKMARKARRAQRIVLSSPDSNATEVMSEQEADQLLAEIDELEPDYDLYPVIEHAAGESHALVVD